MGSGAFARSFIFRDQHALIQAPLALYTATQTYEMSPGYEQKQNSQFMRQISDQCLFCHAGIISRLGKNERHTKIHELSIGCERCHGQGAKHVSEVDAWNQEQPEGDFAGPHSIVHPGLLDREHSQALCAQCHHQETSRCTLQE